MNKTLAQMITGEGPFDPDLQDYKWEVTKSWIEDECGEWFMHEPLMAKHKSVPLEVKSRDFDKVEIEMPYRFRMFDDDGNLYYEGRMSHIDHDPLNDFGMGNAGCTYIKYYEVGSGIWQTI